MRRRGREKQRGGRGGWARRDEGGGGGEGVERGCEREWDVREESKIGRKEEEGKEGGSRRRGKGRGAEVFPQPNELGSVRHECE